MSGTQMSNGRFYSIVREWKRYKVVFTTGGKAKPKVSQFLDENGVSQDAVFKTEEEARKYLMSIGYGAPTVEGGCYG